MRDTENKQQKKLDCVTQIYIIFLFVNHASINWEKMNTHIDKSKYISGVVL